MKKKTEEKKRFLELCKGIEREGCEELVAWLEKKDFFTAPASTRYHDACEGGLVHHSLQVYDQLKNILKAYPAIEAEEESIRICALFHDLCKVSFYTKEQRNRKNEDGVWESYECYSVDETLSYGGHGSKSVYLVQYFMKLKPEEAVAINCHMGPWSNGDADHVSAAYRQFPLAWALHVADEAATYIC